MIKGLRYIAMAIGLGLGAIWFLQVVVLPHRHAVDGSFGLRPGTHGCIGFAVEPKFVAWLPKGNVELNVLVHLRYYHPASSDPGTYCLGQDVWYGE